MRQKRVTIEDVAKTAGVSITTVSRFLNRRYDGMSAATKLRIEQVIQDLNYQPNILAQGLKGNKTKTIAAVVVNMSYPYCVSIIRTLSMVLAEHGYRLTVCDSGGNPERERSLLESLIAQQVEGIVIQTNGKNNALLAEAAKHTPVLIVDRQFNIPKTINVITNNEDASFNLSQALFQAGYHHVVYVTEPLENISTRQQRIQGYQRACVNFEKKPSILWVNKDELNTFNDAISQIHRWNLKKPFAIYTANGLIMLPFYPLIRRQPWSIPTEVGLATFDEPDWADLTTPPMTCVHQPTVEIGRFSAQTILELLQNEKNVKRQQVKVFPSEVLLKESSCLLPTSYIR